MCKKPNRVLPEACQLASEVGNGGKKEAERRLMHDAGYCASVLANCRGRQPTIEKGNLNPA
jgi:hypothetical protein